MTMRRAAALCAMSLPLLSGCATIPGALGDMSVEQLREIAKIKDASVTCIVFNTPYGRGLATFVNLDKGVLAAGTLTVDDQCKTTINAGATP